LETILAHRLSNLFLLHVLRIAASAAQEGYPAIARLALATLHLILDNQASVARLGDPCASAFPADFAPEQDIYANLLLDVLTFLCQSPELLPIVLSILHQICASLPAASATAAGRVISIFEGLLARDASLVLLLLDTFAAVVQRRRVPENGFATAIFLRASLFKGMRDSLAKGRQALGVILAFISTAKAAQKTAIQRGELAQLLASFDLADVFPLTRNFVPKARQQPADPPWGEVTDDMLHIIFAREVARLQPKQRSDDHRRSEE
jgi:hypothetical protein